MDSVASLVIPSAIIVIIFGISCGAFASRVASAKGYDGMSWFWGGFFFSLVALIAVAGLPQKSEDQEEQSDEEQTTEKHRCTSCGVMVRSDAHFCTKCGTRLAQN